MSIEELAQKFNEAFTRLQNEIGRVIVGQTNIVEDTLVAKIVQRQDTAATFEQAAAVAARAEQDWYQGRVPVMAMHDVRGPVESFAHVDRGIAQHGKAKMFVIAVPVQRVSVIELRAVHQVERGIVCAASRLEHRVAYGVRAVVQPATGELRNRPDI